MRENIGLYRGKRIDNEEWVEGYLVKKRDPMLGIEYCFILAQEYDTSCIDGQPTHLNSFMTWYKVDPETVGEYTWLTDKNGKKIFEGDILRYEYGGVCSVEYGRFNCTCCDGVYGWGVARGGDIRDCENHEIIGNIHDNPELLKGK